MKELVLTNEQVIGMKKALDVAGAIKGNAKFSMNVALNLSALETAFKALQSAQAPTGEFEDYEKQSMELLNKYGKPSGSNGINQLFTIEKEKVDEFNEKSTELKEQFKNAINDRRVQLDRFENEILKEQANGGEPFKFYPLPKDMPEDLDGNTIYQLLDLIELE